MNHVKLFEQFINEARKEYKVLDVTVDGNPVIEFQNGTSCSKWLKANPDAAIGDVKMGALDADQKRIVGTSRGPYWVVVKPNFTNESIIAEKVYQMTGILNEAKDATREEIIDLMETKYKIKFVRTSEEFDGEKDGIWIAGDNGEELSGNKIFDYYNTKAKYKNGVLKTVVDAVEKKGWWFSWNDPGTMMIWPKN